MKTTIDLPDDLIRQAKLRAVGQGLPLKDLIATFIRQGLELDTGHPLSPPAPGEALQIGANGLPIFRCRPDAPADHTSLEELLRLEQKLLAEEDLLHAGRPV